MELKVNKFIAQLVLFYCIQTFGKHPKKPIPKLIYSKKNDKDTYGVYSIDKNTIKIFYNRHFEPDVKNPLSEFIDTVIHEYKHYLHSTKLNKVMCKNDARQIDLMEDEAIIFGHVESKKFLKKLNK